MTKKADEPRTTVKITVALRDFIRDNAKKESATMMEYIERKVRA